MKRTILMVIMMAAVLFCSCDVFEKKSDENRVKFDNDSLVDGYYVQTGEVNMIPYDKGRTFTGITDEPSDDRVIWINDSQAEIPVLYKDSKLIYVSSENPLPSSFTLEMFEDMGYTIGLRNINVTEKYISASVTDDNVCMDSSFYENIPEDIGEINITSINNEKISDTLISRSGTILGLEQDKAYTIGYYHGTYYDEVDAIADTHVMTSYKIYPLTDISLTKDNHIEIKLPEGLKEGYYGIDDAGIFYYKPENAPEEEKVLEEN